MHPFWLTFRNEDLESRYELHFNASFLPLDRKFLRISLLVDVTILLLHVAKTGLNAGTLLPFLEMGRVLVEVAVRAVMGEERLSAWRSIVVIQSRCFATHIVLLCAQSSTLANIDIVWSIPRVLAMQSAIFYFTLTAMCHRLVFQTHVGLQLLSTLLLPIYTGEAICNPSRWTPHSSKFLHKFSNALNSGMVLKTPWVWGSDVHSYDGCLQLVGFVMALVMFMLPSYYLWLKEKQHRNNFVQPLFDRGDIDQSYLGDASIRHISTLELWMHVLGLVILCNVLWVGCSYLPNAVQVGNGLGSLLYPENLDHIGSSVEL